MQEAMPMFKKKKKKTVNMLINFIKHCKKWLILEYLKTLKNLKYSVTKYRSEISALKYLKLLEFGRN